MLQKGSKMASKKPQKKRCKIIHKGMLKLGISKGN